MELSQSSATANATTKSRRDKLIEEYRIYVESVAIRLIQTLGLPRHLRNEFISAGYLGLVEAADRFDTERGSEFRAFAFLRIRGAIIDSIRRCCEISHRAYRFLQALEAAQEIRLEAFYTGKPIQKQLSNSRIAHAIEYLSKSSLTYQLATLKKDEVPEEQIDFSDPEERLYMKRESERIQKILATLPDKERLILEQYYFHGKSLAEIAHNNTGLSKSWVSRLHSRGVTLLKNEYFSEIQDNSAGDSPVTECMQRGNNTQSIRNRCKSSIKQTKRGKNRRRKDPTS